MKKKYSRLIGLCMLLAAVIFFVYALWHPEGSFSIGLLATYTIYGVYIGIMIFLLIAPIKTKKEKSHK